MRKKLNLEKKDYVVVGEITPDFNVLEFEI